MVKIFGSSLLAIILSRAPIAVDFENNVCIKLCHITILYTLY